MKHNLRILILFTILYSLFTLEVDAQRIIRKNSRHYVEQQSLPTKVEPLLKDAWDQYAPNNAMCPVDSTGERCVVGCVATAMTQVMHYWQWPITGRGSHTYTDSTGCKQTLTANFSEHTYDWANMLDNYNTEDGYNQAQADAVALLSSDCGISVDMRYSPVASGANSIKQASALANYFGYDRGVQMLFRDFYSLDEITLMLKKELAAGRPILISGYNSDGGHAFVIDGYDENDWFHTCWGNPGAIDNWYTYLPNMVPNQPTWYTKDSPEHGFNILQMFTIGIMPENNPDATGIERHNFAFQYISAVKDNGLRTTDYGEGTTDNGLRTTDYGEGTTDYGQRTTENGEETTAKYNRNDVQLTVHDLCNIGWNTLNDSVSIMLKKDGNIVCPLYTYNRDFLLEEIDDTTYTDTLSIQIPSDIANGTYTIVPMYRDNSADGGKEWREAKVCTGTPNYLIASIKDDDVTLTSDTASTAYLTLEDIDMPDMLINARTPDYGFTLKNHGPEMAGRVYFLMENLSGGRNFYLQEQGVTIGANETYTIHNHVMKFWAPQIGQYRLHLLYESNLFADDLKELELPREYIINIISIGDIEIACNE